MRKLNITEKLSFEEKPILTIKDKDFVVDDSAPTVLKIMDILDDGEPTAKDISDVANLIFGDEGIAELYKLKLNFNDFTEVVMSAVNLILGETEEPAGE